MCHGGENFLNNSKKTQNLLHLILNTVKIENIFKFIQINIKKRKTLSKIFLEESEI